MTWMITGGTPHDLGKTSFFKIIEPRCFRVGFLPSVHAGSQLQIQQKCQLLWQRHEEMDIASTKKWLVGGFSPYPSEKWWSESQLGWWHSIYDGKIKAMFQTTNQVIYHSLEVVAGGMKSEMRTWFVFLDQYSSQSHWKLKVADDLTKITETISSIRINH